MQTNYLGGVPRVSTERTALKRMISIGQPPLVHISKRIVIDGTKSRDWGHTGNLDVLRPGLLLGKATSGGKYSPSILGISQNAYTSGGTTITVTAAQAVEIARRVGTSGNLYYVGPPTAAGTVAVIGPIAFSAINTGTGAITTSTLGVNLIAGGFVCATDGTHLPVTVVGEDGGIKVTDETGTSADQDYYPPIAGGLQWGQLLPSGITDTSLIAWVKARLNDYCDFIYDNDF